MILQRGETDFFSGEPLRALSTLVFSDNVDLQRSASLTFAEITERGTFKRRTIQLYIEHSQDGCWGVELLSSTITRDATLGYSEHYVEGRVCIRC
jgi:hypothetical protein